MSDILSLLMYRNAGSSVEAGIVDADLGKNIYRVKIGRRFIQIKSAVKEPLHVNQGVIINKTGSSRYIVGSMDRMKAQERKEIIISG